MCICEVWNMLEVSTSCPCDNKNLCGNADGCRGKRSSYDTHSEASDKRWKDLMQLLEPVVGRYALFPSVPFPDLCAVSR